jgi:hypothetical protein
MAVALVVIFSAGLTLGTRLTARDQGASVTAQERRSATGNATGDLPDRGRPVDTHLFRTIAKQQNPIVVFITTESRVRAETLPQLASLTLVAIAILLPHGFD